MGVCNGVTLDVVDGLASWGAQHAWEAQCVGAVWDESNVCAGVLLTLLEAINPSA